VKRARKLVRIRGFILAVFGVLSIFICLVLLIGPSTLLFDLAYGPNFDPKFERYQALNQARTQWATQNISSYRMVIAYQRKQYGQIAGVCQEDVEVRNNIIVVNKSAQQPCGSHEPATTIANLFQVIDHDINNVRWDQCKILMIKVTYDRKLGYPQYIKYTWEAIKPENVGKDFFSRQSQCVNVAMFSPDIDDVNVISLSPLMP
jgi:hypothetical protein